MRSKAGQQNKFMRIITIPIRALGKARDFYVKIMNDCAGRTGCGNGMAMGTSYVSSLPRNFSMASSRSSEDDLRELIRAASSSSLGNRIDVESILMQQQQQQQLMRQSTVGRWRVVPRSYSVGMGKIDEDKPYVFGDQDNIDVLKKDVMYPRSKSYAVPKGGVAF